ncbi:MAG: SAM-dependent methyltransferase [Oscillospiraceae bacterium]|nr:SAM-dependent methyltransferase [Oscillospiraceae bacterium]
MLNPRLEACARYVRPGANVCDVGTDHALLAVYLCEQGIAQNVIASDIGEGPLAAAQRTISAHGLEDSIRTILSDGLEHVPAEEVTDIVIAGMGGETMVHILGDCPWSLTEKRLILQPMTKADVLRSWLYAHGFAICEETCVRDGRFLYAVLYAEYTGECFTPDWVTVRLGKMDLSDPDCRAYAERQYDVLCQSRDGRIRAGMDASPFDEAAEAIASALKGDCT